MSIMDKVKEAVGKKDLPPVDMSKPPDKEVPVEEVQQEMLDEPVTKPVDIKVNTADMAELKKPFDSTIIFRVKTRAQFLDLMDFQYYMINKYGIDTLVDSSSKQSMM